MDKDTVLIKAGTAVGLFIVFSVALGMWGCPQYER